MISRQFYHLLPFWYYIVTHSTSQSSESLWMPILSDMIHVTWSFEKFCWLSLHKFILSWFSKKPFINYKFQAMKVSNKIRLSDIHKYKKWNITYQSEVTCWIIMPDEFWWPISTGSSYNTVINRFSFWYHRSNHGEPIDVGIFIKINYTKTQWNASTDSSRLFLGIIDALWIL